MIISEFALTISRLIKYYHYYKEFSKFFETSIGCCYVLMFDIVETPRSAIH